MSRNDMVKGAKGSKIPAILLINKNSADASNTIEAEKNVVEPSPVLARLRAFLPEMAAANDCLAPAGCSSDFDIVRLDRHENGDEESESDSSSDSEAEENAPHVEIDVSLFKNEGSSNSDVDSSDNDGEELKAEKNEIPKAFDESDMTKEPKKRRSKRNLIEEVDTFDDQSGTKGDSLS